MDIIIKSLKSKFIVVFIILTALALTHAGNRTFGLGAVLGEPTGINAKLWLKQDRALSFTLAYGWGYNRYGRNYYYSDSRCYDNPYYKTHVNYCNDRYSNDDRYNSSGFHIHGDYLFHNFNAIKAPQRFPLYYGPGINLESYRDYVVLGGRMTGGIAWMHRSVPFDVFFELSPILQILPGMWMDFTGGLGARYYF